MPQLAFRCPHCAEAFQVAPSDQGQAVACPHCGRAVAIPRVGRDPAGQSAWDFIGDRDGRSSMPADGPYEIRSVTRQERAAIRRRVNLLVFALSAAILAIAVVCLLLWRG